MKWFYDLQQNDACDYKKKDKVWLEATNIKTDWPMKKLTDKWLGPFEVIEKVGQAAYKLKLPLWWKGIYDVFHEVLLSPYEEPSFNIQ